MSSTTPIKQAKPAAAAGSEKDPVRMIEKLETKTKAVYVLSLPPHVLQTVACGEGHQGIWTHPADRSINRNANNVARVANSQLVSADDKLHPLMSLKNGRTLEKFPDTPKALAKLSG
jgi:hypothetical protein